MNILVNPFLMFSQFSKHVFLLDLKKMQISVPLVNTIPMFSQFSDPVFLADESSSTCMSSSTLLEL